MSPTLIGIDELKSRPASAGVADEHEVDVESIVRTASDADVDAIHRLVSNHMTEGRLLPRSREEIAARVGRFIVAVDNGRVVGCADLAPLSRRVAEVRSLVVDWRRTLVRDRPSPRARAREARARVGFRIVDGVHPYAGLFRSTGVLDRAAHVGAGKDRG